MAMDPAETTEMAEMAGTAEAIETPEATDMAEAVEVAEIEGETIPSRRPEKDVGAPRDGMGGRGGRAGISPEEVALRFLSTRTQWASP